MSSFCLYTFILDNLSSLPIFISSRSLERWIFLLHNSASAFSTFSTYSTKISTSVSLIQHFGISISNTVLPTLFVTLQQLVSALHQCQHFVYTFFVKQTRDVHTIVSLREVKYNKHDFKNHAYSNTY